MQGYRPIIKGNYLIVVLRAGDPRAPQCFQLGFPIRSVRRANSRGAVFPAGSECRSRITGWRRITPSKITW